MANPSNIKQPADYIMNIRDLKNKVQKDISKESVKGVVIGAGIGILIGAGYSILYKKKIIKGMMWGAIFGSAISFSYSHIRN